MENLELEKFIEEEYKEDINPQLFTTFEDENLENLKPITWDDIIPHMQEAKKILFTLEEDVSAFKNLYHGLFSLIENLENNFKTLDFSIKELFNSFHTNMGFHTKEEEGKITFFTGDPGSDYSTNIAIVKIANDYKLISTSAEELRVKMLTLIIKKVHEYILSADQSSQAYKELMEAVDKPEIHFALEDYKKNLEESKEKEEKIIAEQLKQQEEFKERQLNQKKENA